MAQFGEEHFKNVIQERIDWRHRWHQIDGVKVNDGGRTRCHFQYSHLVLFLWIKRLWLLWGERQRGRSQYRLSLIKCPRPGLSSRWIKHWPIHYYLLYGPFYFVASLQMYKLSWLQPSNKFKNNNAVGVFPRRKGSSKMWSWGGKVVWRNDGRWLNNTRKFRYISGQNDRVDFIKC